MAKVELLVPKILKWEGGYVNDPLDHGGATNMGVTESTWKQCGYDKDGDGDIDHDDIKLLSIANVAMVLKKNYWDRWQGDKIVNQSVAEILVDWVWGSGKWGIIIPQRLLGLNADGMVGPITIASLNNAYPQQFFSKVWEARHLFLHAIVMNDPSQQKFLKGWLNRLRDYQFKP